MSLNTTLKIFLLALLPFCTVFASAKVQKYDIYDWTLAIDNGNGRISLAHAGKPVVANSLAQWCIDTDTVSLADCGKLKISRKAGKGKFGAQTSVYICGKHGQTDVVQSINFYPGKDFVTTAVTLSVPPVPSAKPIVSNYIAPIAITETYKLFDNGGNYAIFIPYDNDAWVRYRNTPFGEPMPVSYEVTALINAEDRRGIVIGSVEHDTWKTGIKTATNKECSVDTLIAFGGVATTLTRDIIPHGKVKGQAISSPLILVGDFADWRDGMEQFGDACATIAPKIAARGKRPFGWNSWGKLQTKINYDKAVEVSDFIHDSLQKKSFNNDGVVYIGLDAFWDFGFKPEQHRQFVEHCAANGQKAGIYYCPFTDWGKNPEATIAELPQYKFKDCYLYGDGKILEFDGAYALDPTHPAVKARIARQLKEFIDWGYEYVKIDFMAHGAYEGDSHFDPKVTTGVQAYSQGMQYIDSIADGKLWINLSIAPLFPANYAHSRRIGCDAWADINNTEYTLNGLTYGWWLDHVYHNNDADHIVLEGVSEGENRARITSSAITGVYLLGDDMSKEGDATVKERIADKMTNAAINAIAAECKSFRPVEIGTGDRAADTFYSPTDGGIYVAVFNFGEQSVNKTIDATRLGLTPEKTYATTELWSGTAGTMQGQLSTEIPGKDVKVFKISL